MLFLHYLRNTKRRTQSSDRQRVSFRTQMEALEVRSLLSALPYPTAATVSQLIADMNSADTSGGAFTINLNPNTTFDLGSANNATDGGNGLPVVGGTKAVDLTLVGNGDTIKRVGSAYFRLLDVAAGSSLTLNHVTLQGGSVLGGVRPASGVGGAILNLGTLTITDSTLTGNTAAGIAYSVAGGGIFNGGGVVTISNSILSNNTADWGNGGGIYNAGGTVLVSNSSLSGNVVSPPYSGGFGGYGGGIYNDENGKLTVQNTTTITGNFTNWFGDPFSDDVTNFGALYLDSTSTIGTLYGNPAIQPGKTYIGPNGGNWSSASNWSPSGVPTASDLETISGKSVSLGESATVGGLTLTGGAALTVAANGGWVLRTSSISIAGAGSKLNLSNNKLIVAGGGLGAVTALIASGRNGGAWNGNGIVTSSASGNLTTLGVAASGADVVVKFTYGGDANLDGKLNIDDYVRIDQGIAAQKTGWSNGDFNYDGRINIDDYVIIDGNIPNHGPPLGSASATELLVAATSLAPNQISAPTITWSSPGGSQNDELLDLLV